MNFGKMNSARTAGVLLRLRRQSFAVFLTLVGAVLLPQLVHAVGVLSGSGSRLGEILLPMHFPILLVGFLCGPAVGGIAGLLAPAVSFALTAMPGSAVLPYMMVELCVYGLAAGWLSRTKCPSPAGVLLAQIAGRLARVLALLLTGMPAGAVLSAARTGWIGILLQLALIPLLLSGIRRFSDHE